MGFASDEGRVGELLVSSAQDSSTVTKLPVGVGEGETFAGSKAALGMNADGGDGEGMGIRTGAGVKYSGNGMDAGGLRLGVDG